MTTAVKPSRDEIFAARATEAKAIASKAQRKAKRLAEDSQLNRTTRTRAAMKVKADALDAISEAFAGRSASS